MSEAELFPCGAVQWRCTWCNRTYISKIDADECCKGKPRMKQIRIDGQYFYYGEEHK